MSISNMVVKVIGIILVVVGLGLILSAVGLNIFSVGISPWWLSFLLGLLVIGIGIWVIKGGNISL